MRHGDRGLGVTRQTAAEIGITADLRRNSLDRNRTTQPGIAGAIHLADPVGADMLEELVLTECFEHRPATASILPSRFARAPWRRSAVRAPSRYPSSACRETVRYGSRCRADRRGRANR